MAEELSYRIEVGSSTTGASSYIPYNTLYHDNRCQYLILPDELMAGGIEPGDKLVAISYMSAGTPGKTLINFRIRLGETNLTTYVSGTDLIKTGLTLVHYESSISTTSVSTGKTYRHNFNQSEYVWGGNTLIVDVTRDDSSYVNGGSMYIRSSIPGASRRMLYMASDSGFSWPFDSANYSYASQMLDTTIHFMKGNALKMKVKVTGAYKNVSKGFYKDNGLWKPLKSDWTKVSGTWRN